MFAGVGDGCGRHDVDRDRQFCLQAAGQSSRLGLEGVDNAGGRARIRQERAPGLGRNRDPSAPVEVCDDDSGTPSWGIKARPYA
jgi:hypothetical protein